MAFKCSHSTGAKVGRGFCDKSYDSFTKKWYYRIKLHTFVMLKPGSLPFLCTAQISPASVADLTAARQMDLECQPVSDGTLFADKAYCAVDWSDSLYNTRKISIITPQRKKSMIFYALVIVAVPWFLCAASPLSPFFIGPI